MPQPEREPRRPDYRVLLAAYDRAWQRHQREPTPEHLAVLEAGHEILVRELFKPGRFELGRLVGTPGAFAALAAAGHVPPEFLLRHKHGDWGDLPEEDIWENDRALREGGRLFSAYHTRAGARLWVITEWDRSATTLLKPDEY